MSVLRDGKRELDRLAPETSGLHSWFGWMFVWWCVGAALCGAGFYFTGWQHFITAIIATAIVPLCMGFWWLTLLLIFASP